jgi:S1-C subfamily serine protease
MSRNSGTFSGSGPPPRKLNLSVDICRFPLNGDSWLDNDTGDRYFFNDIQWVKLQSTNFNFQTIIDIYQNNINSIVTITSYNGTGASPVLLSELNLASGFFVSPIGHLVTTASAIYKINSSLIDNLPQLSNAIYAQVFPENIMVPISIIGINRKADFALLKINLDNHSLSERSFLSFTNSRNIYKGEFAITLGCMGTILNQNMNINYQQVLFGTIMDNKWINQTHHRESINTNYVIPPGSYGGPTMDLNGNVIGIASWSEEIESDLGTTPFFTTKGSIASNLINPIFDYFMSLPTGTTGAVYPSGFFGIAYDYYVDEMNIINFETSTLAPKEIIGIQLIGDFTNSVRYISNNTPFINEYYSVPLAFPNPYLGSPAANLGLEIGDIIIAAAKSGEPLEYIGNTDTGVPFDTIVHLATNTGMIDIQYLKKSENWQNIHMVTNIGLTGIPNIINHPLNRFT